MNMKSISLLILLFLCAGSLFPSHGGEKPRIQFAQDVYSLGQIKEILKSSRKPGFLYFTRRYCPPSRRLEDSLFTDEAIIRFVGESFISFKITSEDSGKALFRECRGSRTPTILFLDTDGARLHTLNGFSGTVADYLAWFRLVLAPGGPDSLRKKESENQIAGIELLERYKNMTFGEIHAYHARYYDSLNTIVTDPLNYWVSIFSHAFFSPESAMAMFEEAYAKNLFDDSRDYTLCRMGNLIMSLPDSLAADKYKKALSFYERMSADLQDLARMNKSSAPESSSRLTVERGQNYLPFAYFMTGNPERGEELLNERFEEYASDKDYGSMERLFSQCENFKIIYGELYDWAVKAYELSNWKDSQILYHVERLRKLKKDEP